MAKKPVEVVEPIEVVVEVETPATEVAVAEASSTAVVNWEDRLAVYADEEAAEEQMFGGKFVGTRAGVLVLDKVPCANNKLDVIVVASTIEHAYYEGKFDPNNIKAPVCFAFGKDEDALVPHVKSVKPQATSCATCPKNDWGSDPEGGRGKACKTQRRLGLIAADSVNAPDKIMEAEEVYIRVPVMSVKNWAKYVNDCKNQFKRPVSTIVTQIGTKPDAKSQFVITFTGLRRVEEPAAIEALLDRHESSQQTIGFPYQASVEAEDDETDGKNAKF
jgi:hypothetical protein